MKLAEWNKESKARLWVLLWAAIQLFPMSFTGTLWLLNFATCLFCLAGWGLVGYLQYKMHKPGGSFAALEEAVRYGRTLLTENPRIRGKEREELEQSIAKGEELLKNHAYFKDHPYEISV